MDDSFLLTKNLQDTLEEWECRPILKEQIITIMGGFEQFSIHTIENCGLHFPIENIVFFYLKNEKIDEQGSIYKVMHILKTLKPDIVIFVTRKKDLDVREIRCFKSGLKVPWIIFSEDEFLLEKMNSEKLFLAGIVSYIESESPEMLPLANYDKIDRDFSKLIKKVNILHHLGLWEEVLINLRKITENIIHIWWNRTKKRNDDDLRDPSTKNPLSLKSRLEKVKQENGISSKLMEDLLSIKGLGDNAAHDMRFQASPGDLNVALPIVRKLLDTLISTLPS